ncbi:MAG: hypothetical protein RIT04_379 [Candidatus Parcubacteria bacterium]|jgi:plasmid stability protein
MKRAIPPEISEYIDQAIEKQRVIFHAEMAHDRDIIIEKFQNDLKAMTEQFPTRSEVRDIVREELHDELRPIRSDIAIIKTEISSINKKLSNHEVRITRLERKVA